MDVPYAHENPSFISVGILVLHSDSIAQAEVYHWIPCSRIFAYTQLPGACRT